MCFVATVQSGGIKLGTRGVPRAIREAEMVDAATRLFAEREYEAVSMEEIAKAADVSKPMVYAYFESKQGLFLACVEHWTRELMNALEQATPEDLPPDVRMWRGLLAVFTFIEDNPAAWALMNPRGGQLAAGAARSREEITGLLTRLLRDAAVAQGIDPKVAGEATEPMAHAIGAAVQAVAAWAQRGSSDSMERQALRLMNFVWMGLDNLMRGKLWLPPVVPQAPAGTAPEARAGVDERLAEELRGNRDRLLDGIFQRMAESFNPEPAGNLEVVVEWRIEGREDGGHDRFQLVIAGKTCRVDRDGDADPDVTFTMDGYDFLRLVSGDASGPELFTFGLMKVDGDQVVAAQVPRLFGATRGSG
jgi:AcrR family transcriptional regulator/putative sterol carrier protein